MDPALARARTREELVYLLTVAAELEHLLCCSYMFAAFSLKSDVAEGGLTKPQLAKVVAWKRAILSVAIEEMQHLAQVSNLLTAVGAAAHMSRPNFPQPKDAYPFGVPLDLEPFSRATIEKFVRFELPEDRGAELPVEPAGPRAGIEPFVATFATIGELYHAIGVTIEAIPEEKLFIGARRMQTDGAELKLGKDLVDVTDRASALRAIERIVEQGEAAREDKPDAHFHVFRDILRELDELESAGGSFVPARAVTTNPVVRQRLDADRGATIMNRHTHAVAETANLAYETLILALLRLFSHLDSDRGARGALWTAALRMMKELITPLGEALSMMPFDGASAEARAGIGFGLTRSLQLVPQRRATFVILAERLERCAIAAEALSHGAPPGVARAAQSAREIAAWIRTFIDNDSS